MGEDWRCGKLASEFQQDPRLHELLFLISSWRCKLRNPVNAVFAALRNIHGEEDMLLAMNRRLRRTQGYLAIAFAAALALGPELAEAQDAAGTRPAPTAPQSQAPAATEAPARARPARGASGATSA